MVKILYITNGISGSGGLERVLSIKTRYFVNKYNYDINILTINDGNNQKFFNFDKSILFHDIKVQGKKPFNYFLSYRKGIKRVINTIKPDVILVCDDGLKGLMFPFIFGKDIPLIYERHISKQVEVTSDCPTWFQSIINILKFKLMDIAGSKFDKFVVLTKGNTKEWDISNITVIPNPVPFNSNDCTSTSLLSSKTVLVVGKQSYQKGYDRLLKIWKIVNERHSDWKLEVYGKLNPELGLELKAQELGLSETVTFFPPSREIQEKYKNASIYLMTSRYEGFGMVLIEAMCFGLPCISFNCPYGPSDIIIDKENGFIIENGNIDMFAAKVIELIDNKNLRIEMGEKAKKSINRFYIKKIGSMWDELFKEVLKQRKKL